MLTGRALGSVAACVLVLGTGGAQAAGGRMEAAAALTWRAEAAPFRLELLQGGRLVAAEPRLTKAGPSPGTRLGYWLADGAIHRVTDLRGQRSIADGTAYEVGTDEPGRSARVSVRRTSLGVRVSFELVPSAGVAGVYEAFSARPDEHFLGTGERGGYVDLRGQIVQLKVSYDCASTIVTPFYLSSSGYGVYLETSAVGHIQFAGHHDGTECAPGSLGRSPLCRLGGRSDRVELCVKASRLDYEVYAGTPEQVLGSYTARAGRPALPPPSQLELIK